MKKIIIILVVISIIIILFILNKNRIFHKKIHSSLVNNINNYRNNILKNEKFLSNNEGCTEKDTKIKYACFTPEKDSFFCMIPNIQPFEYYDSIKMIVESKNFIFILNEGMDTVMRASKKDFLFENISDFLYSNSEIKPKPKEELFIPLIGACYETDQCFAYTKKYLYNSNLEENIKNINTREQTGIEGKIWILGRNNCIEFLTEPTDDKKNIIKLDLISKLEIEGRINLNNEGEYSLFLINKEKLYDDREVYKSKLYNFHGNNKYLGKVRFNENRNDIEKSIELKTNFRVIGDVAVKFNFGNDDTNYEKLNNDEINIYAVSSLYRELNQYIINKDYLSIIRLVNDKSYSTEYFKKYVNVNVDDDEKIPKIKLNGEYINKIYDDIIDNDNLLEHAKNQEEKQLSFENKIDEIRKKKILEYARECLKVLCNYKKIFVCNGLSIGVQDFNLNDDRLIIQYTESSQYKSGNLEIKTNFIKINKSIIEDDAKLGIFEKKFSDFTDIEDDIGLVKEDDITVENFIYMDTDDSKYYYKKYKIYLEYQKFVDENKILENGACLIKNKSQILTRFKDNYKFDNKIIKDNKRDYQRLDNENHKYFYTFEGGKDVNYNKYFQIRSGSMSGKQNIFGILDFTGDVNNILDKDKKHMFHKRPIFFMLFAKPSEKDINNNNNLIEEGIYGPLYLKLEFDKIYDLVPSIKFDHPGMSLYNWFSSNTNFANRREWFEFYDVMKSKGIYLPNPSGNFVKDGRNFDIIYKEIINAIKEDKFIGENNLFSFKQEQKLLELKKEKIYNTEIDKLCPNLNIFRELGMHEGLCYIEIIFEPDNNKVEETDVRYLGLDKEPEFLNGQSKSLYKGSLRREEINNKNIYPSKEDDNKNHFHYLFDKKKKEIAQKSSIENIIYKWNIKRVSNFKEYLSLVTGDVRLEDNARDRVRGLYEIDPKFMDEEYLKYIKQKKKENPFLKEIDKVIEMAEKNIKGYRRDKVDSAPNPVSAAHIYPFFVIYKTVDYYGNPCLEGAKNSEKLFLTNRINKSHIVNENNTDVDYSKLDGFPFIKEEFLSFTGMGNDIQFFGSKIGGITSIEPKKFCNTVKPLPIDDCKMDLCFPKKLGLVRLDGSAKCAIQDSEIKQKPETPNSVEIIGNVPENACDLFKLKGNKKFYYRLGRIFEYNRDGKIQVPNMYTIKNLYNNTYFYATGDKIEFRDQLIMSDEKFKFESEVKSDSYGTYYLFKPKGKKKYITRKVNLFDREFEEWNLEGSKEDVKRNLINENNNLRESDPDYYSQKFSVPQELMINMATQDSSSSPETDILIQEQVKAESIRCQTSPELCEGDKNFKASMTPREERKFLNKQLKDIQSMMNKINQVPSAFYEPPDMKELAKFIKKLNQEIPKMNTLTKVNMKANQYLLELDEKLKKEEKQVLLKEQEKKILADSNNMQNNSFDTPETVLNSTMAALRSKLRNEARKDPPKCYNIETFDNPYRNPYIKNNGEKNVDLNKHISDMYSGYVENKMKSTKDTVAGMQEQVAKNLQKISKLSNSTKLEGNTKQILLSDKINNDNKLNQDIYKIKNIGQQERIVNISKKLEEIEKIKSEMNEDDFKTKKMENQDQFNSLISRVDGKPMNIYSIRNDEISGSPADSEANKKLLFVNDGCLNYENLNIDTQHCMIGNNNQMFNLHRVEDMEDMKKYNIKNQHKGMERPFSIIKSNDGKCLHKENEQLSFRNCDNIKNQYWDYSSITGPNN